MSDWFDGALNTYARVAVTGGPKAGKTTLCERVRDRRVLHGDDYMHLGWSESSEALAKAVNELAGPLVVEGVQVPRALRKGMRVDVVIWLDETFGGYVRGHATMREGCMTVLRQWRAANQNIPVLIISPRDLKAALPVQEFP